MIIFDLACDCGCQFEGWFRDHDDFLKQKRQSMLACPHCGGFGVRKILSPVAVHTGSAAKAQKPPTPDNHGTPSAGEIAETLKVLRHFVEKNFEDVGANLAQEALKIHYGVEKVRNIRGVATADEEQVLEKEGVKLLKLSLPEKANGTN